MIDQALAALASQLNAFLNARFGFAGSDRAAPGHVPDLSTKNGAPEHPLTLSLVRVEEERVVRTQTAVRRREEAFEDVQPDVKLNLFVLVTSHGSSYPDVLKFLSATVQCFQSQPVLDATHAPGLDPAISRLVVELHSQTFEEQNHLWGSLSLRYVPSVLYRVRMLVVQESAPRRVLPPIQEVDMEEASL